MDAYPVVYDPRRKEVLFLSLSRPVNDLLKALFRDTFGAELVPETPWRRGTELLGASPRAADLDALERTDFADAGDRLGKRGGVATLPSREGVR